MQPDVLITGAAVVSPIGIGRQDFWQALMEKRSGIGLREPFTDLASPFRLAAQIPEFSARDYIKNRKSLKVMCREIQLGCVAANLALEDAKLDMGTVNPDRIGVVTGTETFFCDPLDVKDVYRKYGDPSQIDYGRWIEAAMREIEPLWMLKYLPNMVSCQISIAIDARGPSNSIVQGDASSLLAVIEAANLIRRGTADVMIVGGSGSKTNLVGMVFHGVDNLCRNVEDPTAACRPFDLQRSGRILGEGAGMLVLESAAHAAQRGATPLGRITGMASSCCTLQQNKQATIARVLGQAAEAIGRELIDHVAAFGESDREADVIEAQAIANVLPDVDVLALKSYYGSTGAGGGAMDLVASLTAMEHDCLPATLNYQTPDPACPLRLSNDHLQKSQSHAIVLAHSYTGQSAAIAVSSMR